MQPFTIAENRDGSVDVLFQEGGHEGFGSVDSFRHVFRRRGLTESDLDLVLENHRYLRRGLSYCTEPEKREFRELADALRRHPAVRSWQAFRELIHLHPSVDPRRLVADGGTKTHLVALRHEATRLLGKMYATEIRERSEDDSPNTSTRSETMATKAAAKDPEAKSANGHGPAAVKISKREDLPVLNGKQSPRTATPIGKKETVKLALYLRERYSLDGSDIGRLAGLLQGGAAALAKGFPPARLDLLKQNIRTVFGIDADADILHGENDRYHVNGKTAGRDERRRVAAGLPEPTAPAREPNLEELIDSGREHLRAAQCDFKSAQGKLRGMMSLAMDGLLQKIREALDECDGGESAETPR